MTFTTHNKFIPDISMSSQPALLVASHLLPSPFSPAPTSAMLRSATAKQLHDMMTGETREFLELREDLMKDIETVSEDLICSELNVESFLSKIKSKKKS